MPLGLAKDSMINLAEMVQQQKESEEENNSREGEVKLEDGEEETLVMRLSTHEIATLEAALEAEEKEAQEEEDDYYHDRNDPAQEDLEDSIRRPAGSLLAGAGAAGETIGETDDSVNTDTASSRASGEGAKTTANNSTTAAAAAAHGSYPGFSHDYSEYEHYGDYSAYSLGEKKQSEQPFWCCLFPWFADSSPTNNKEGHAESELQDQKGPMLEIERNSSRSSIVSRSGSKDEDETSTGSDVFGERLSDKDRQAVLARLRLAQPDAKSTEPNPTGGGDTENPGTGGGADQANVKATGKGLLNGIITPENGAQKRGILKQTSTLSRLNLKDLAAAGASSADGKVKQRRSLFPSYETNSKPKKNLHVEFSPMARVLTVKSQKDMDEKEKSEIWWQRSDYEEFRKTGRMITKAMLEGGSEIWLATNQSWQTPNKDKQSTLSNAYSLAERHAAFSKGNLDAKREYEETRDKWWHKFGHSRRGLEHIASIDEGRQRQNNVKAALKAVLEEQRRQKIFHREDPEKLRMVCIQHTSWARDLSMASGASDADAVQMNFDEESRKSREFYLLKFSRSNQMTVNTTQKASVPAFMKPVLTSVNPSRLDANTVPQIRFRQSQNKKRIAPAPEKTSKEQLETVPIRDDEDSGSSMAKQAAGFASGEEIGNMSSVLTGMGAISVAGGS